MLIQNINIECGLTNGSIGTVLGFSFEDGEQIPIAWVLFDGYRGPSFWEDYPNTVPIKSLEVSFYHRGSTCSRRQLPLVLCFSMSIHKAQGMSIETFRYNPGKGDFALGLTYVALSRATTREGWAIDFPQNSLTEEAFMRLGKGKNQKGRQLIDAE